MHIKNLLTEGLVDYAYADKIQRQYHKDIVDGKMDNTLIVAQFKNVYTVGSRTKKEHLLNVKNYIKVDRGGSVTWHGAGQLVVYPIVRLKDPTNVILYIRTIEKAVLQALQDKFSLQVTTLEGKSGVWLTEPNRKICAIGLRVANGVTMHGIALNISPDMYYFSQIIPCGLSDCSATSLKEENVKVDFEDCANTIVEYLEKYLKPIIVNL